MSALEKVLERTVALMLAATLIAPLRSKRREPSGPDAKNDDLDPLELSLSPSGVFLVEV